MKIYLLLVTLLFASFVFSESITMVSQGLSIEDFEKQGGHIEVIQDHPGYLYRVKVSTFENCAASEVSAILKTKKDSKLILKAPLEKFGGWYGFELGAIEDTDQYITIQIQCSVGIPIRTVWLNDKNA